MMSHSNGRLLEHIAVISKALFKKKQKKPTKLETSQESELKDRVMLNTGTLTLASSPYAPENRSGLTAVCLLPLRSGWGRR